MPDRVAESAGRGATASQLRTVFMGTPEIAVPALRMLAARTRVSCLITQPDRPAGRGHQLHVPPIKEAALACGLPVWQPETLKGAETDERLACDLVVVMAYGELLRQPVLDRPRHGCINLHASLLPRWRGASPLQAAIRAGDPRTGVSVMRMVRGLDAGPVFLAEEIPLEPHATLPGLHDAIALIAASALDRFLTLWPDVAEHPQDESRVTLCRKLTAEDGHLDPTQGAAAIERWVRAYTPSPGCWLSVSGERVRILAVEARPGALPAGQVAQVDGEILIGCGEGMIAVTRLQLPGKRAMTAREFLNGHRLPGSVG
ncbi:MAG: methionyl-tRNA formyltransferase [Planctomycetes bacterium]|nr:methionyl-tRNA formyltransferase [Planctomycetota bacterium]